MITAVMIITFATGMLFGLFLAHVDDVNFAKKLKEFEGKPKAREDDDEVDNYRSNYHCRD